MEPYYRDESVTLYHGDNAAVLPTLAAALALLGGATPDGTLASPVAPRAAGG